MAGADGAAVSPQVKSVTGYSKSLGQLTHRESRALLDVMEKIGESTYGRSPGDWDVHETHVLPVLSRPHAVVRVPALAVLALSGHDDPPLPGPSDTVVCSHGPGDLPLRPYNPRICFLVLHGQRCYYALPENHPRTG
jgi:hypothetical protein